VHSEDTWACWEDTFKTYIYPVLKQIGICSTCPPAIGELAAVMSKLSPDILNDTFRFFTAEAINHKVTEIYLRSILKYH
uniref:hypothetical protein n=1 Tax=Natrialba sp. PRR66 TaxID=3098146 RepID=UPI002B1E3745